MSQQDAAPRYHDLDSLRAFVMFVGLLLHAALPFKATDVGPYSIAYPQQHWSADATVFALRDFRTQTFFLLAGFFSALLCHRRGLRGMLANRFNRLVLPLGLAVVLIAPTIYLMFRQYLQTHAPARPGVFPDEPLWSRIAPTEHLWFLYYLVLCYVPLLALRALPASVRRGEALFRRVVAWRGRAAVLALVAVPALYGMPQWLPDGPGGWTPSVAVWAYDGGFFLFGWLLYRHRDLLPDFGRGWLPALVVANLVVLPLMVRLTLTGYWTEAGGGELPGYFPLQKFATLYLGALYTWLMIQGLVGAFQRLFARQSVWGRYVADSSFWVFLVGNPVQLGLEMFVLADLRVPGVVKFVLDVVLATAVLLVSYQLFVRNTVLGLILNGPRKRPATAAVMPALWQSAEGLPEDAAKPARPRKPRAGAVQARED